MKAAYILALTLIGAAPAAAETANQVALREARTYFVPCSTVPAEMRKLCAINQSNFLENYELAKGGTVSSMADISLRFDPDPDPIYPEGTGVGIRLDKRQGCAWIIVTAESTHDSNRLRTERERWADRCSDLSINETRAIKDRAEVLLHELRTHPAKPPPEPKPLTAAERRCLDSTACALGDDTCPEFVPPKGCPKPKF